MKDYSCSGLMLSDGDGGYLFPGVEAQVWGCEVVVGSHRGGGVPPSPGALSGWLLVTLMMRTEGTASQTSVDVVVTSVPSRKRTSLWLGGQMHDAGIESVRVGAEESTTLMSSGAAAEPRSLSYTCKT